MGASSSGLSNTNAREIISQTEPHFLYLNTLPEELQGLAEEAKAGSKESQYALAYHFDVGIDDVDVNTEEAIFWYIISALKGHSSAQYNLGVVYFTGHQGRIVSDPVQAAYWFGIAAEGGNPHAQFQSALLHLKGLLGNNSSDTIAAKYLQSASDLDHTMSQALLGTVYLEARGVALSVEKGLKYLLLASQRNDVVALYNLSVFYNKGYPGTIVDKIKSEAYLELAREANTRDLIPIPEGNQTLPTTLVFYE